MSDFQRRSRHKLGLRSLLAVAALAAIAVVLTPAGSAGTTTKPYGVFISGTPTAGGVSAQVSIVITNEASPQTLGSANITAPTYTDPATGVKYSYSMSSWSYASDQPPATFDPTSTSTLLKLRNLNLAPGAHVEVDLTAQAPCQAGTYAWGIQVKQANDFSGSPGNDFTQDTNSSRGLTVSDSGGCSLIWTTQPTSAAVNTTITGTAYSPSGNAVSVQAVAGDGVTPITTGSVSLALSSGTFSGTSSCGFTGTGPATPDTNGVASFPNLKANCTSNGNLTLKASAGSLVSVDSNGFSIDAGGCTSDPSTGLCTISNIPLQNGLVNISGSGGFGFIAVDPSQAPSSVTASGGGCANFGGSGKYKGIGTGNGFTETDGRTASGTIDITVSIPNTTLKTVYGANYGQPNVPICFGAKVLVNNTTPINCNASGNPLKGWNDRTLGTDGKFNGGYSNALCDPTTGYWWGILGTFQDPNSTSTTDEIFDSNQIPLITGWGSSPDGSYRTFTIHEPSGWDGQCGY